MQHFSAPAHELSADAFEEGLGFDGSSIRGFQEIQESDMILVPDPNTAVIDPFRQHRTLNINCFVRDPITLEPYSRDPRYVAKKAEDHLTSTGLADTAQVPQVPGSLEEALAALEADQDYLLAGGVFTPDLVET